MNNSRLARVLTAMLLIGCARHAAAQHDATIPLGATIRTLSCALPPARGDERTEGTLVDLDSGRVAVQSEMLHELPTGRTLSIERKTRESHRVIGAVIGAPLGYILGGILGRPSEKQLRESDGFAAIGVPLGKFVGTFIGAFIGGVVSGPRWVQVSLPTGAGSACASRD